MTGPDARQPGARDAAAEGTAIETHAAAAPQPVAPEPVAPEPVAPEARRPATRRPETAAAASRDAVEDEAARGRGPFLAIVVALALLVWVAHGVLAPFIVAAVLAYAFSPLVTAGERRTGWPRILVVAIGYVIALALVAVLVALLAGRVAGELHLLATSGPDAVAATLRGLVGSDSIEVAGQTISVAEIARQVQARLTGIASSPSDAVHLAAQAGEVALQTLVALVVTFYLLVDGTTFRDRAVDLLPSRHQARTSELLASIHDVLGKWLRGQLLLIALVAVVAYLLLGPVLHLPYALAIAIVTGVLEIIPVVGPLFATVIAATDAFVNGGAGAAAIVVVAYLVLRQVEDQVVMPLVIGRAVHLHPVITIFAVLVGLTVYGILGGLLAVPAAAAINVVFRALYPPRAERPAPA